jgi:hypothetical protein
MELTLALIGGLGLGSIITSIVAHFMSRRAVTSDRWYQEKREAYLGLLGAIHEAAIHPSNENSKAYALWQTRCDLFGSPTVAEYAQLFADTQPADRTEKERAFRGLIKAMKSDLSN